MNRENGRPCHWLLPVASGVAPIARVNGSGGSKTTKGRICALDLGAARVGVALSDELGMMAHPRGALAARPRPKLLEALKEIVAAEGIARIVVGFPLDMRGTEGEAARRAREIAQQIADATDCDVELFDERLTTVQAQRALTASEVRGQKARDRIDEASAVEILQAWLDARASRRKRARR
jgi:putative holliday junction resolvase